MKKIFNNLFLTSAVTIFFVSCKNEELADTAMQEAVTINSAAKDSGHLLQRHLRICLQIVTIIRWPTTGMYAWLKCRMVRVYTRSTIMVSTRL